VAVSWGIISTAHINEKFLAGAALAPDAFVVAVASRDGALAERYAHEHGIERAHGSYEALLADPAVEALYIPLPNALHVEWTLRALAAGKHVLCEKPLTRHPAEVAAVFDAAERSGLHVMEAFMYRHHPQTERLAALVAGGAIGRLRMIRAQFSFLLGDPANVRLNGALAGGALMDLGCYCVSSARLLAGEPVRVSAEQVRGGEGVDVAFAATLRFAGDVLAHFDAGFTLAPRDELEVVGDAGSLFLDDPWHCVTPVIELRRPGEATEAIAIAPANPYALEIESLCTAIRGGRPPLLGRADALGQARAIDALYRAADGGIAVAL